MGGAGRGTSDRVLVERWHSERHHWHPHVEQALHRPSAPHWRTGIYIVHCMYIIEVHVYTCQLSCLGSSVVEHSV